MISLFLITLFGAMIPGASFVITVKNSICGSRQHGLMTALGLTAGMSLHVAYLLPSLYYFKHNSLYLTYIISICGAVYLFYFGIRCLRAKPIKKEAVKVGDSAGISLKRAFLNGFITDTLNPKIIIFTMALFSQYVDDMLTVTRQLEYGFLLIFVQLLWFSLVAMFFSNRILQKKLYAYSYWIERISGTLLIGLSFRLLFKTLI